ncbi:trans-sialidase [Trypanosoma cruzi cruzi]|uniref:Putative trans-sialidase, Group VI n=1 Tax=Trypanosoma cruzi TaxID=5693 RepID=A0A2V2VAJ1_TRYCR|nr:trans-sialidase [Trypanosoma cruzi cruzi]PWU92602.1 putative trans-sialidase, Group VI [Trypanosoma cruzi]
MLSRVAAVMAPRTHNRRCVTGSRGRRREGGESEPQRPNMSRHLFCSAVLLLIVVMMCDTGRAAQADVPAPDPGSSLGKHFVWRDKKKEETVSLLYAPSLLDVNGKVFAVAEAQCTENDKVSTGIASKLLTLDKKQTKEELDASKVKTQVLEDGTSEDQKKRIDVSRPTTVVEGSDIYMLAGKYSRRDATDQEDRGAEDCGLLLVKGKAGGESSDSIIWGDTAGVPCVSTVEEEKVGSTRLIGSGGSGVKMHDDTLVFPVQDVKEESGKTVSLLIYTLKDANEGWTLSKGIPDGGCSDPSVVEWGEKDKKLIMMTACDDGRRRVYESGDMGESWTEALGTLSRVWGNKNGNVKGVRSGFITAKIDGENNRNVMLVTLPVYPEEDSKKETGNGKGKLHLWLTDNTHIVDIGPVSDDDAAASSLLYKSAGSGDNEQKEELIALYEKKKDDGKPSHSLWSVLLTEQLQRVKDVLATWKEADDIVSKLCPSEEDGLPDTACRDFKITDGLVGFLSGNFSGNTWRDEYLGVNATVKNNEGVKQVKNGVTFHGAWAEWPVGEQGENQLYHFANYNFTLVATVSIDKVPKEEGPIPLMGVKMSEGENPVLLELSYDKEKKWKWKLLCGGGQNKELSSGWEKEKTQQVVILLRNGTQGSAYVDGKRVGGDVPCKLENTEPNEISHFFIGGDGNSAGDAGSEEDVSVTVTNVLLYNRPLSSEEIIALNAKISIPKQTSLKAVKEVTRSPEVRKPPALETMPQTTLGGDQLTAQQSLKTSEDAGGAGASTTAVSTLTNSPAGKESVNKSTPGTSPDGGKTVDGGSTAGSEPTTETREGGTNGQEVVNTQDREVNATALSSSLGNVSQGNNTDAGTVRGSGPLPPLLLLLLGLWVFAAL